MKIVCISDTHTHHRKAQLPEGDLLIHAGDISNGQERQITDFLKWFEDQPHPIKVFIAGNMDAPLEDQPQHYRSLLPDNVHYLENQVLEIDGLKLWGSPVVPNFFGVFNYRRGAEIRHFWDQIPEDIDLLITHTPPQGILDRTSSGMDVGCLDLRHRVETIRPKLHLFGHVHESYGLRKENGTTFINASFIGPQPKGFNQPVAVEL